MRMAFFSVLGMPPTPGVVHARCLLPNTSTLRAGMEPQARSAPCAARSLTISPTMPCRHALVPPVYARTVVVPLCPCGASNGSASVQVQRARLRSGPGSWAMLLTCRPLTELRRRALGFVVRCRSQLRGVGRARPRRIHICEARHGARRLSAGEATHSQPCVSACHAFGSPCAIASQQPLEKCVC